MTSGWTISGVDLYLEPAPAGVGRRAWLENAVRTAVREGRLAPGTRLPPTRSLATELGVARGTVTAAYDQLVAEGYLIARRGAGTVVADLTGGGGRGPSRSEPPVRGEARTVEPVTGAAVVALRDARPSWPGSIGTVGGALTTGRAGAPGGRTDGGSGVLPGTLPGTLGGRPGESTRPRHDLVPGRPDLAAFPVDAWVRATRRVLPRAETGIFANTDPRGLGELREQLAEYLGRVRGVRADPEAIVVTSGVMQGVALLAEVLHRAGVRAVAMEEPSLPFHQEAVRRRGHQVVPVTVDEYGARCELAGRYGDGRYGDGRYGDGGDVGATGEPESDAGPESDAEVEGDVGAVVLTPTHQAGFGVTLAPERRRAFVDWARSSGGLIIEDDYDGEFRYDRQPVGALQGMAPEHVAYLGTVSKTLAPGLRIGWMVLPPRLVLPVAEAKFHTDVQNEVIGQLVLAELIRGLEYDRHVRVQRQRYRRRRDALLRRLRQEVPEVRIWGAAAGVQLFLQLPAAGPSEEEVLAQARRRGLRLVGAGGAWQRPDRPPMKAIGVGYGTPPDHAYPAALDALVDTLRAAFDA